MEQDSKILFSQSRVERLVHQSALRAELVKAHRKAACWLDDVPMSDRGIRRYERRVKYELACRIEGTEPTDPPADSESEGEDAEMPALAAAADTAAANGGDDDEYSDGGGFFDAADGPDASFAGVQVWTTPDDVAGARARVRASRPMPKCLRAVGPGYCIFLLFFYIVFRLISMCCLVGRWTDGASCKNFKI
jgi:hypothetical protein